ncbi:MAG: hypothetical protein V3S87_01360 [Alphaproteobacteria bacterium]
MAETRDMPGVYALDASGEEQLVHLYQGGNYGLADVVEISRYGRLVEGAPEGESVVELSRRELEQLKSFADAYSFDFEEPFIEMCHEMERFALALGPEPVRFTANF